VRRCLALAAVAVSVSAAPVRAAPAVAVFHAAGAGADVAAARDAMAAEARAAHVAWIDATPAPPAPPATGQLLRRGLDAYDALRFEPAATALDGVIAELATTGGDGLSPAELSDAFLYRGLARIQLGDAARAWDDLVGAAILDPVRVLDPVRFPPRAVEAFERARQAVAELPRDPVTVAAPAGCRVTLDGAERSSAELLRGPHFASVRCPGRSPWGARIVVAGPETITAAPAPVAGPDEREVLVQARALGGDAVLVTVTGAAPVALLRRIGLDGRERGRATVALTGTGAPQLAARTLAGLLVDAAPPAPRRWWQSRWVWAAGGAAVAAAVLVPIAVAAGDGATPQVTLRPDGLPW